MVQHLGESVNEPEFKEEQDCDLDSWNERSKVHREEKKPFERKIVWFNAIGFLALHLACLYALYLTAFSAKLATNLWAMFMTLCGTTGVQMGAHRLFSHKSYKAKPPLRMALVLLQTLAGQNCLWVWVRDHRQHHKYSDTDADPHNANNGFFFSHIGWLMSRKHPDVVAKGKTIDMSDMEADAFVMFQKRYYKTLYVVFALALPTVVPCWLWGETFFNSLMISYVARTVIQLNGTWLINSAAHKYGNRPFTKDIVPVECEVIRYISLGEGWHNYHHTFPWDYKAAELGQRLNLMCWMIEKAADFGWAYDLRSATPAMVAHRILKRGDGTHRLARTMAETPELLAETPERLTETPEFLAETPERLAETPNRLMETLELLAETPERLTETPKLLAETPERLAVMPERLAVMPERLAVMPERLAAEERKMTESPGSEPYQAERIHGQ